MKTPILVALGCAYLAGRGFAASTGESIGAVRDKANAGDAPAQCELGFDYETGRGVPVDLTLAMQWLSKSAAQGNVGAMEGVGALYETGKGVKQDPEEAMAWYQKAAAASDKTGQQNFANGDILRLSRTGLTREKYAGIPVEGGTYLVKVDETTPIADQVKALASHTAEIETGKMYWIGYNSQMLSIAARGDAALPDLVSLVKNSPDPKVRRAGILTIHLIGIDSDVAGRFYEDFKNRHAREALWDLMKVEGVTDEIADLLKRDPWPADVPAIMAALAQVKADCPDTLNALHRYHIEKCPIDTLANSGLGGFSVSYTLPVRYTDRDYLGLQIKALGRGVDVEPGLLDQISTKAVYGNYAPVKWQGTFEKLLETMKDLNPPFDYIDPGRNIYYYAEGRAWDWSPGAKGAKLHICSASTAKHRLLDWWKSEGRDWYCYSTGTGG